MNGCPESLSGVVKGTRGGVPHATQLALSESGTMTTLHTMRSVCGWVLHARGDGAAAPAQTTTLKKEKSKLTATELPWSHTGVGLPTPVRCQLHRLNIGAVGGVLCFSLFYNIT